MPYKWNQQTGTYEYEADTPESRYTYSPDKGYFLNDPTVGKTSLSRDLAQQQYRPGAKQGTSSYATGSYDSAYDTAAEYGNLPAPAIGPMKSYFQNHRQQADEEGRYSWLATDTGEAEYKKSEFAAREAIRRGAYETEQSNFEAQRRAAWDAEQGQAEREYMTRQQQVEDRRKALWDEEQRQAESNWNIEQQRIHGHNWKDKAIDRGGVKDPFKPTLWQRPEYQAATFDPYIRATYQQANRPAYQAGTFDFKPQEKVIGSTYEEAAAQPGGADKMTLYWEEMKRPNLSRASRSGMTGIR